MIPTYRSRSLGVAREKNRTERFGRCRINKTSLPPYLTLYTRKILLNRARRATTRSGRGEKKKHTEAKCENKGETRFEPRISNELIQDSLAAQRNTIILFDCAHRLTLIMAN